MLVGQCCDVSGLEAQLAALRREMAGLIARANARCRNCGEGSPAYCIECDAQDRVDVARDAAARERRRIAEYLREFDGGSTWALAVEEMGDP
jgi:hypothetical protein